MSPLEAAYEYASLPLCVIDAVFSLGARYESTERTVQDWCKRYGWRVARGEGREEHRVTDFLNILQAYENRWDDIARDVFANRQRTSTRSGILKAEAVYRFSKVLQHFGIETFADSLRLGLRDDVRQAIKSIPGQGSGLSFHYFLILAGHTDAVKADRMVRRFVANALGMRDVSPELAENLVRDASTLLRPEFPKLSPSALDNKIWKYQRGQNGTLSEVTGGGHGSNDGPELKQFPMQAEMHGPEVREPFTSYERPYGGHMKTRQQTAFENLQRELHTKRGITAPLQVTGEPDDYVFTAVNGVTVIIGPNGGYIVPAVRSYLKSSDGAVYADEYWAKQDNHPATASHFITGHLGPVVGRDFKCVEVMCPCQSESDDSRRKRSVPR